MKKHLFSVLFLFSFLLAEAQSQSGFFNFTYSENTNYKSRNNIIGCIYGTPIKIGNNILPEEQIIVLEMNNSENIIEGIGILKNKLEYKKLIIRK